MDDTLILDKILKISAEYLNKITKGNPLLTSETMKSKLEYEKKLGMLEYSARNLEETIESSRLMGELVYKLLRRHYEVLSNKLSKYADLENNNTKFILDLLEAASKEVKERVKMINLEERVLQNVGNSTSKEVLLTYASKLLTIAIPYTGVLQALMDNLPEANKYILQSLDKKMGDTKNYLIRELSLLELNNTSNDKGIVDMYLTKLRAAKDVVGYLIELALLNELKEAVKRGPKGLEKYANILREHYEVLVSGGDPKKMENIANYAKEIVEKYINEATNLGYRINYSLAKLECTLNLVKYHDTVIKKIVKEKLEELNKEYYNVYEPYIRFLERVAGITGY
jgi:predicted DNA-binding protein